MAALDAATESKLNPQGLAMTEGRGCGPFDCGLKKNSTAFSRSAILANTFGIDNPQSAIRNPQSKGPQSSKAPYSCGSMRRRAERQCPCGFHGSIAFLA
jgi:hypothetical protein